MAKAYLPQVTSDLIADLSHNNALPNPLGAFRQAATAIPEFAVIHKASQGTGMVDPAFSPRRIAAANAGIKFGAYHFCDHSDPTAQADHFLAAIGDPAGLVIVLDAERNKSQVTVAGVALIASRIYRRIGVWPGVYMGRSGPDGSGAGLPSKTLAANCWLWLAEYGNNPVCPPGWPRWTLWQHTDGHIGSGVVRVPGIGPCDRSRFAGTADEFRAWWQAHAIPGPAKRPGAAAA
jgi:lysozyme